MATERPRPVLQNELVVAHDDRHSYMQRMHSLAGPGAYKIPSTFQHRTPNLLLRMVQRENYGREFARQNRITATSADTAESPPTAPCQLTLANTHRARREQLRKTLQADRWCQDDNVTSPSPSKSGHRASRESSPRATSPNDRAQRSPSPSSRASSPGRLRWTSADLADIVADFGEPAEMDELLSEDAPRMQQKQLCTFSAPLTYQQYLVSTSYLERLKKHQQHRRRQRAASQ
ncbi:hypothetical protein F441_05345 [Phytophthora nicotianae CJ01A1]|uniref:Uncharacterized protein n=4 Tax=Phytophthora nicotianae TaxID=4792 RepID=W2QH67_PHYN3|nr:hypothetical protein PPTG_09518 [Phytophthora nicotianae INRA-310]ETI51273.1 hypothetical protein F443_05338 [Phytophthora nicotianae P1569]ETL44569.1 hypothetical protein L916_05155 [Phytophthora nicotianae]ETP21038.1 hypothetical protein F441_05345 [Phytophthora nicotianae CJ01A1]ETL97741.1 hypothetical protein L917_05038 [Phytophthora nicotianae]ETN11839.1 hypothetical protein PPTG_09518 [Phytophthora nicotianae INRA-310]